MAMGGNHSKLNSTTKSLVRLDPLFGFSIFFSSPGSGYGVVVGWMEANAPRWSLEGPRSAFDGWMECRERNGGY
jgi:hypothetical protein